MLAGYSDWPGVGNTPPGGMTGFESLFTKSKNLNYEKQLGNIDALILWGGSDISTSLYNTKPFSTYQSAWPSTRDIFEWELMRRAFKKGVPIIGVCRGAQILCAFAGGKLAQDVTGHQGNHSIQTYDGKVFQDCSSAHHQMMFPYLLPEEEFNVLASVESNRSTRYEGLFSDEKALFLDKKEFEPECVFFPTVKGFAIQGHPEWEGKSPYQQWLEIEILVRLFGESKET
jgi:GMP synthase-like glutamine amidotransferase